MRVEKARLDNHLLLCLNTLMCLSQSCTIILLHTNVIYAVMIFKVIVDMAHPWENALNGFVQFAQYFNRMTSLNVI